MSDDSSTPLSTQLIDSIDRKLKQLNQTYQLYKSVGKQQYNNHQLSTIWSNSVQSLSQSFLTTPSCIATGIGYSAGIITYIICMQSIHTLHSMTRISSAMKKTATLSGLLTIPLCAIIAGHTMYYTSAYVIEHYNNTSNNKYIQYPMSTQPYVSYYNHIKQKYHDVWLYNNNGSSIYDYNLIPRNTTSSTSTHSSVLNKLSQYIQSYKDTDNIRYLNICTLVYGISGLLSYRILGGRLRYTCPSDLYRTGTYMKVTLPAIRGNEYADKSQKLLLQQYGRTYGCHHCGVRWGRYLSKISDRRYWGGYIGDHIPPNKYSTSNTKQLFLPQCTTCSSKQSSSVRDDKRRLVLPRSLRLYNLYLPIPLFGLLIVPILYSIQTQVDEIKQPTLRKLAKSFLFDS